MSFRTILTQAPKVMRCSVIPQYIPKRGLLTKSHVWRNRSHNVASLLGRQQGTINLSVTHSLLYSMIL